MKSLQTGFLKRGGVSLQTRLHALIWNISVQSVRGKLYITVYTNKNIVTNKKLHLITVKSTSFLSSAGTTITPNYLDNSTSNVGPWCSCAASGNHREQCYDFLFHFHDNICLSESRLPKNKEIDIPKHNLKCC